MDANKMRIQDRVVNGYTLYAVPEQPLDIQEIACQANAEGCVLLKNDHMLPLKNGDKVAVFGRMQKHYTRSGTGSGGLVNAPYNTNIFCSLDALATEYGFQIDHDLEKIYDEWDNATPLSSQTDWEADWSQEEMPITKELCAEFAAHSNKAIIIISRTAGEGHDSVLKEGAYYLSEKERNLLDYVSHSFKQTCVILNVGGIMDNSWMTEFPIDALMYVWQGGQDGGRAVAEVLCGARYPSGKLADTIIYDIKKHPAYDSFFEESEIPYSEDIFVGYRFFETFDKENVQYPFGFGMGYTEFDVQFLEAFHEDETLKIKLCIKNTGVGFGKETVQLYFGMPQSQYSRPEKQLIAFIKTRELAPGESQLLEMSVSIQDAAIFVDTDDATYKNCYIIENGEYEFYLGTDVRSAKKVASWLIPDTKVIRKAAHRFGRVRPLNRLIRKNGVPMSEYLEPESYHPIHDIPKELPYTGDRGIKLEDVYRGKTSMNMFVSQLSDFDLACLTQGEGMNSAKVRPGCGGAFGGLNKNLLYYGIPPIAVTDGPSGLRFDNGDSATSLPNGTLLACTWNEELVNTLYVWEGMEAYAHKVDALLGPGINVHRFPLCGRNFEYLSEDPYLTGKIGAAMCTGLKSAGVTATVKHFAVNNREHRRFEFDAVISERALREIYLKPFEMAIQTGTVSMVMTAYNQINGVFCSGNYDLVTGILREEWGYQGIVMTDWWTNTCYGANGKEEKCREYPIHAQTDLYMVNDDAEKAAVSVLYAVRSGLLSRAELQRVAMNICRVIIQTPNFERFIVNGNTFIGFMPTQSDFQELCSIEDIKPNEQVSVNLIETGQREYVADIAYVSNKSELMQIPVKVKVSGGIETLFMVTGTNGKVCSMTKSIKFYKQESKLCLDYEPQNVNVLKVTIKAAYRRKNDNTN